MSQRLTFWLLASVLLLESSLLSQDGDLLPPDAEKGWRIDPYTKGEPEALAKAGYVAMNRLEWGDDHSTIQVDETLGAVQMLWVETEHFRIGSSLPEYKIPKEDKPKLQAELKVLKKILPKVKDKTRELDRWMRLHLYARRLEQLYERVQEVLGVTDADFPSSQEEATAAQKFMGNGKYLGRRDKYCVLLFEKKSGLGRYGQRYGAGRGGSGESPLRLGFHGRGSLAFATTAEYFIGHFENDVSLHNHVVFNITSQLLDGYRDYYHAYPRWIADGMGQVLMREIDEDYPTFSSMKEPVSQVMEEESWGRKVRARVKVDYYPSAQELMRWPRGEKLEFANHTMMWSRVDFLLQEHPQAFQRFLSAVKEPIVVPGRAPTDDEIFAQQEAAMKSELGFDGDGFDEAWSRWVLKNYPKR